MARACDICGKQVGVGNNRSFSNRATRRRYKPNLHTLRVPNSTSTKITLKVCTKCRRTLVKA